MKLAWATDIHLDHAKVSDRMRFYQEVLSSGAEAMVVTGDIAEANTLPSALLEMVQWCAKNDEWMLYFVLGNHDFYGGSVKETRLRAIDLARRDDRLHYAHGVSFTLTQKSCIVGADGWADGRFGNYEKSFQALSMTDWTAIRDLRDDYTAQGPRGLLDKMHSLAQESADHIVRLFPYDQKVIIATHVPPFVEACRYEGKMSDDVHLPHFASKVMGDTILKLAAENPTQQIEVLCGHTHGEGVYQAASNVLVRTGKAEYGKPALAGVLEVL